MSLFSIREEPSSATVRTPVIDESVHLLECNAAASAVSLPRGLVGVTHSVSPFYEASPEWVVFEDFVQDAC